MKGGKGKGDRKPLKPSDLFERALASPPRKEKGEGGEERIGHAGPDLSSGDIREKKREERGGGTHGPRRRSCPTISCALEAREWKKEEKKRRREDQVCKGLFPERSYIFSWHLHALKEGIGGRKGGGEKGEEARFGPPPGYPTSLSFLPINLRKMRKERREKKGGMNHNR